MPNQDQFGIIQNLQTSPIPQTSFLVGTIFAASYSKTALIESTLIMNIVKCKTLQKFCFKISLKKYNIIQMSSYQCYHILQYEKIKLDRK